MITCTQFTSDKNGNKRWIYQFTTATCPTVTDIQAIPAMVVPAGAFCPSSIAGKNLNKAFKYFGRYSKRGIISTQSPIEMWQWLHRFAVWTYMDIGQNLKKAQKRIDSIRRNDPTFTSTEGKEALHQHNLLCEELYPIQVLLREDYIYEN